jgi:hypothetical protein
MDADEEFEVVIKKVATACEAGEIGSACRSSDGKMIDTLPDWHADDWRVYFRQGVVFGPTDGSTYWIFVREGQVERFVTGLTKPTAPEAEPVSRRGGPEVIRSGAPGRPTSMQLIEVELDNRIAALKTGEMLGVYGTEVSKQLSAWLKKTHPAMPPCTAKTIANKLRPKMRPHLSSSH